MLEILPDTAECLIMKATRDNAALIDEGVLPRAEDSQAPGKCVKVLHRPYRVPLSAP